ncbi:MAG: beta-galactosidase trimerization domain-containing protein [bacterium]
MQWIWLLRVASLFYTDDVNPVWVEERVKEIREMGFNSIILFGFHYRMYFPPEKREDIVKKIGMISDICHKYGLKVFEHHSATLVPAHHIYLNGKDIKTEDIPPPSQAPYIAWAPVDARTGKPDVVKSYDGIFLCPNNPGHQEAYLQHVRDILTKTSVDGLMSDDVEYLEDYYSCACPFCKAKFKKETGIELPPADDKGFWGNYQNAAFRKWLRFRQKSVGDHYERLRELRDKLKPSLPLLACQADPTGLLIALQWALPVEEIARGADILFYEACGSPFWRVYFPGWKEIASNILFLKGLGERLNMPVLVLFYPQQEEEWFFCWSLAKSFGANVWFSPSKAVKDYIKWEENHPYLFYNSTPMANIAILFSRNTRDLYVKNSLFLREWEGWCSALLENSIPFRVITDDDINLERLSRYQLLILPDIACLSDKQVSVIKEFVRKGGKLVATGETSLYDETGERREDFALREIFGLSHKAIDQLKNGFAIVNGINVPSGVLHDFGKGKVLYISNTPGVLAQSSFKLEGKTMICLEEASPTNLELIKQIALWGTKGKPSLIVRNRKGVIAIPHILPNGEVIIHILNIAGSFYKKGESFPANEVVYPDLKELWREDKLTLFLPNYKPRECSLFIPPEGEENRLRVKSSRQGTEIEIPLSMFKRYAIIKLKSSR